MAVKTVKKTVGRQLVEKAGIDVEKLLDLLVRNASAELTKFYYYTILRVNLIGLEGEGLKQIAEDARIEDRNHFEALVRRIYELGGHLPADMVEFHNISACPPAKLPANRETSTPYWKCYWGPSNAPSKAIPTLRHDLRQGPSNLRSFAHNPARRDRA